jgi:excinuclease UvrABC nuclease subunit
MEESAEKLEFEKAAEYRDRIIVLEKLFKKP